MEDNRKGVVKGGEVRRLGCERWNNATGIERNLERFRELEREVWDSREKNHAEKTRFETRKGDDIRRQQKRDSERGGAWVKLREMETATKTDPNVDRFGELEREVRERQDSWEKNDAEKLRFETQKGDDIRRQQKRESERAAELIKLQKMENTAEIERNHDSFRELEYLTGCTLYFTVLECLVVTRGYQGSHFWNPLAGLGLKLKDQCHLDDDDDDDEDDTIFEKDTSHLVESYGHSNVIVEEKCKNSPDDSMPLDEKTLRAAMLKNRYSEIILKAQQKTLFN